MKAPVWISREVVLATQEDLLVQFGGLPGIRDPGLLDSALHRPLQLFEYGAPDLFDLAAAYAYGIARNHPFLDGNKRIAFMAAYVILGINGHELNMPEEEVVLQTLGLAAGEVGERAYARWLRRAASPRKG